MSLSHIPFTTIAFIAWVIGFGSAWIVLVIQLIWKGGRFRNDTFLDQWWQPASIVRFFTIRRDEVDFPFGWACIVLSRAAFLLFAISLALGIAIN